MILWFITGNEIFGKVLGYLWIGLIGLILIGIIIRVLTDKKELTKKHYYGKCIINRNYFKGKQSDWQYNHFRFEIKENDSIYFYVTEKESIVRTYRGSITTTGAAQYPSERLIINMEKPTHHILTSNPTTYRSVWNFYLVFNSPKFNNVYFRKGQWESLEE